MPGLGHVSLNTTNVYAEVDMEMKAKALATCEVRGTGRQNTLEERRQTDGVPTQSLTGLCGAGENGDGGFGHCPSVLSAT